jgi:hypothetical protein
MKKSHRFDEMSNVKCKCGKKLKARVVENKQPQNARKCYRCYSNARYAPTARFNKDMRIFIYRECVASHRAAVSV